MIDLSRLNTFDLIVFTCIAGVLGAFLLYWIFGIPHVIGKIEDHTENSSKTNEAINSKLYDLNQKIGSLENDNKQILKELQDLNQNFDQFLRK